MRLMPSCSTSNKFRTYRFYTAEDDGGWRREGKGVLEEEGREGGRREGGKEKIAEVLFHLSA